jgi:hypothetical protein
MKWDYIKADSLDIKRLIKFEIWTADKGIDEVDGDADQQGWKIAKVMNSFDAAYVFMMELVDQYADVHLLASSQSQGI